MRILFTLLICSLSFISFSQGSGRMMEFNGSSNYIDCGTINLSGSTVTMQGWVYPKSFKSSHPYISSLWGTEIGNNQCMVRLGDASVDAEKVQFVIYSGSTHYKLASVTKLKSNTWYHIAATYDGSSMKIYINGKLDASTNVSSSIVSNGKWEIGRNYGNSRILDGKIDEVSVFKATLTQATIRQWMCQTIKKSHPNYSKLEGYWKLDEASGTTTADFSGKSHTGTLMSSPTRSTSQVPLGDTCVVDLTLPLQLSLGHSDGDSILVDSVSGASVVYIYQVNGKANHYNYTSSPAAVDSSRYWGVFYPEASSPKGDVEYFYKSNSHYKKYGSCLTSLVYRIDNSSASWGTTLAKQTTTSLKLRGLNGREYLMTYGGSSRIHSKDSTRICENDSVMLSHSTSGFSYKWYKNNALLSTSNSNTLHAKDSGDYQLIVDYTACKDTTHVFKLRTNKIPTVSFDTLKPVCASEQFYTLSPGKPAGGIFINPYISGNMFVVKNAGAGNHKITYKFTDNVGCSDTASQVLKVLNLPSVKSTAIPSLCRDSMDFTLTNGSPSGGDYYVNGSKTSTFSASSLGAGKHWVKYKFTDANNCFNQDSTEVEIKNLPSVTLNLRKKVFCEYDGVFTPSNYSPKPGKFTGQGVTGGQFFPKTAGVGKWKITYDYTESTTGCSNTISDSMTVHAKPAKPTITENNFVLSSSAAGKYQWYDVNGAISGETKQSFTATSNGTYQVKVTTDGCVSDISEAFAIETLGLVNGQETSFSIYPNPFMAQITIETSTNAILNYKLTAIDGSSVIVGEIGNGRQTIETSTLSKECTF